MSQAEKKGIYFPNLDGLRFVAAAMVFFPHVEQFKTWLQVDELAVWPYPYGLALLGVALFFVLSGFLITYLLLHERAETDDVAVKWFYLRRVLRIWPLYYLVVLLGLVVGPQIEGLAVPELTEAVSADFGSKAALYLLLCPHLVTMGYPPVPFLSQAWSIGIEEQFYVLWPWVVRGIRGRLPWFLAAVILTSLGLEVALKQQAPWIAAIESRVPLFGALLWGFSNFGLMACGGLLACAAFHGWDLVLRFCYQPVTQVAVYLISAVCIVSEVQLPYGGLLLYGASFAVITVNLATNPRSLVRLEHQALRYLGKISYGIYMLHPLATIVTIKALRRLDLASNLAIVAVSAALTLLVAVASYELFERRFLALKRRFTVTVSGEDARSGS